MFRRTLTAAAMLGMSAVCAEPAAIEAITEAAYRNDVAALESMREKAGAPESYAEAYALAYLNYRLAGAYLGGDDSDRAGTAAEASAEAAKRALELEPESAEALALLSATIGMKIAVHPFRGMWLGRRAGRAIEQALKLAPENPRVRLINGIGYLNRPGMFGGSAEKAVDELTLAIDLARSARGEPDWGLVDAYIWRGLARIEADDAGGAEDFASALEIVPGHVQARELLDRYSGDAPRG